MKNWSVYNIWFSSPDTFYLVCPLLVLVIKFIRFPIFSFSISDQIAFKIENKSSFEDDFLNFLHTPWSKMMETCSTRFMSEVWLDQRSHNTFWTWYLSLWCFLYLGVLFFKKNTIFVKLTINEYRKKFFCRQYWHKLS